VEAMLALNEQWKTESALRVEVLAESSYPEEFTRAIVNDIPLVPTVFAIMSAFTCFIFLRRDPVLSRSLLGFGGRRCCSFVYHDWIRLTFSLWSAFHLYDPSSTIRDICKLIFSVVKLLENIITYLIPSSLLRDYRVLVSTTQSL